MVEEPKRGGAAGGGSRRRKLLAALLLCALLLAPAPGAATQGSVGETGSEAKLVQALRTAATDLRDADDLDPLMDAIGEARYVLLGEASHGTSEYYTWRAELSRRLIEEEGFAFVAVEGDWPDLYRLDRYVKGEAGESAYDVLYALTRWPTWMWANWEVVAFAEWLREHNDGLAEGDKVGFYGLDVYSLWASLEAVVAYLEREHPAGLADAEGVRACFAPYQGDEIAYARATLSGASCEAEAAALLGALRAAPAGNEEAHFAAEGNAHVVVNAERYYRAMAEGGPASWNVRDTHMADTLDRLVERHGAGARAIVWEHNTHIGDARATPMAEEGMVNLGQLVRERHGEGATFLVGFGSYRGSVVASRAWGAEAERMPVPAARAESWEALFHEAGFHEAGARDLLLVLAELEPVEAALEPRGHRAIGVVYHPEREGFNYVPTALPRRYDAFIYLDETEALHPLHAPLHDGEQGMEQEGPPRLYPWGF